MNSLIITWNNQKSCSFMFLTNDYFLKMFISFVNVELLPLHILSNQNTLSSARKSSRSMWLFLCGGVFVLLAVCCVHFCVFGLFVCSYICLCVVQYWWSDAHHEHREADQNSAYYSEPAGRAARLSGVCVCVLPCNDTMFFLMVWLMILITL